MQVRDFLVVAQVRLDNDENETICDYLHNLSCHHCFRGWRKYRTKPQRPQPSMVWRRSHLRLHRHMLNGHHSHSKQKEALEII